MVGSSLFVRRFFPPRARGGGRGHHPPFIISQRTITMLHGQGLNERASRHQHGESRENHASLGQGQGQGKQRHGQCRGRHQPPRPPPPPAEQQLQQCAFRMRWIIMVSFALVVVTTRFMLEEMNWLTLLLSDSHRPQEQEQQPEIVILVQLSGELGNHLSKLAYGRALQLWLQEEYGIAQSRLVLRHQGKRYVYKWEKTHSDLQRCFPWTRSLNFTQGNDEPIYQDFVKTYSTTTRTETYSSKDRTSSNQFFGGINSPNANVVAQTLQTAVQVYRQEQQQQRQQGQHGRQYGPLAPIILYSTEFVHGNHFFLERYYGEFRHIFRMSTECCPLSSSRPHSAAAATLTSNSVLPDRDETVVVSPPSMAACMYAQGGSTCTWKATFQILMLFLVFCIYIQHVRNYLEEMPRKRGKATPYDQANPTTLAYGLLGHLPRGHKVALIGPTAPGRFRGNSTSVWQVLQSHATALRQRGLATRIVGNRPQPWSGDENTTSSTSTANSTTTTTTTATAAAISDDMKDFCFLQRTQKELVGLETSTFVYWASILGQAQRVQLYTINHNTTSSSRNMSSSPWWNGHNAMPSLFLPLQLQRIQFVQVTQQEAALFL